MMYHKLLFKPSDVEKTALITNIGLFEFAKIPFGLCKALSTY